MAYKYLLNETHLHVISDKLTEWLKNMFTRSSLLFAAERKCAAKSL